MKITNTDCEIVVIDELDETLVRINQIGNGSFDNMGNELRTYLQGIKLDSNLPHIEKLDEVADGMGCLAAQLVKYLKQCVGSVFIGPRNDANYKYQITYPHGKLFLTGYSSNPHAYRNFPIYIEPKIDEYIYTEIAEFVYRKTDGITKWRKIGKTNQDDTYISGLDFNDDYKLKKFRIDNIVGGKEKIIITPAVQVES